MQRWKVALAGLSTLVVTWSVVAASAEGPEVAPAAGSQKLQQRAANDHEQRRSGPRLRQPDGSSQRASRFSGNPPLARGRFFPIGVWFESVIGDEDIRADKRNGLNTYMELTTNTDLDLVQRSGMRALTTGSAHDGRLDGYLLPDEVDMWAGPGQAGWTGNWPGEGAICEPEGSPCGYSVVDEIMADVPADRYVHGQFGKGVGFWETDAEAARFVNRGPDALSASLYWFTDPNICGSSEAGWFLGTDHEVDESRCRRPYNYGLTVERLRDLVQPRGSKPVWVFVEVGHPFGEDWAPTIAPRQLEQAVWSGIVHGARGVVYFNHNFGGDCFSFHVLRDACGATIRPTVRRVNATVQRHARLLNSSFVDRLLTVSGDVDAVAKLYRDRFYVIVAHRQMGETTGKVTLRCGGGRTATDVSTGETTRLRRHSFRFALPADEPVRIFRLQKGKVCKLGR